jgi:hypothetical protein
MGVQDVTRAGVLKAIAACDAARDEQAFLRGSGFGPAREYTLLHNGKPYASKAIVGVAHGYDRPDLGPLDQSELSGGIGPRGAARVLEQLGFDVASSRSDAHSGVGGSNSAARAPYLLYVSKDALSNIGIGEDNGIWGLPGGAVDTTLTQLAPPRTGRDVLEALAVGDLVLAASQGPSPRVPAGTWRDLKVGHGVLWRVTRSYHYDDSKIWPAPSRWPTERYPHRFGVEKVEQVSEIDRTSIGPLGMEALWYSANNRGVVLPPPSSARIAVRGTKGSSQRDPALLLLDGDLDVPSLVKARREQGKARTRVLAGRTTVQCELCGLILPAPCCRLAHVKRRSACSGLERRQLKNLMLACALGCDHLFELGYVYVDSAGRIRRSPQMATTPDLDIAVSALAGRACLAHDSASEPFFAWHRNNRRR